MPLVLAGAVRDWLFAEDFHDFLSEPDPTFWPTQTKGTE